MKKIAIDFEFNSATFKLFCVAANDGTDTRGWWLGDPEQKEEFINWFKANMDALWLAHFYEIAEAKCLETLGIDTTRVKVFDTGYFGFIMNDTYKNTSILSKELSLANCCKNFLGIDIDSEEKERCRRYCIDDRTEGHEDEILEYCKHDVAHMHALEAFWHKRYEEYMGGAFLFPYSRMDAKELYTPRMLPWEEYILKLSEDMQLSRWICNNGISVSEEAIQWMQDGAAVEIRAFQEAMNMKFPDTFTLDKKGSYHVNLKGVQEYAGKFIKDNNIKDWPRTPSGSYELSADVLKDYDFREDPRTTEANFMEWWFYWSEHVKKGLNGITTNKYKDHKWQNWTRNLRDGRIYVSTLNPNKAKTQRWQGLPAEGYVPQWTRYMRGVMDPPEGKYLIEVDFHSQETALMGLLYDDPTYQELYKAEDPYIFNAIKMGLLPEGIKKKDLTKEQASIRKKAKTFTLAWQYGAGAKRLSSRCKITQTEAVKMKYALDKAYSRAKTLQKIYITAMDKGDEGVTDRCVWILPDGYPIFTRYHMASPTTLGNQPIQSFGAYILRQCLRRCKAEGFKVIAPVHDAIWIETDNVEDGERLKSLMNEVAQSCTGSDLLYAGEPFVIAHGDLKCEEGEDTDKFRHIIEAGKKAETHWHKEEEHRMKYSNKK